MKESEVYTTLYYSTMLNRKLVSVVVEKIRMTIVLGGQPKKNRYECRVLDGSERQITVPASKLRPLA
jgi:hypothetical protein